MTPDPNQQLPFAPLAASGNPTLAPLADLPPDTQNAVKNHLDRLLATMPPGSEAENVPRVTSQPDMTPMGAPSAVRTGNLMQIPSGRPNGAMFRMDGMTEPGNIPLANRPIVNNPDGTSSTVSTMTNEEDGRGVLTPTIVNGKRLSEPDAFQHYRDTGEHMGKFDTEQNADNFDKSLHNQMGWNGAPGSDQEDWQQGNPGAASSVASMKPLPVPTSAARPLAPTPTANQAERTRLTDPTLQSSKPGWQQIHNPILRTLAGIGNGVGTVLAPRVAAEIPGTTMHHNALAAQNAGLNKVEQGELDEASKRKLEEAQTENQQSEAANRKNAAEVPHTLATAAGIMQWNPETKRFDIPAGQSPEKEETEGKTVTTDQGVMQWNPKTKTYDIRVGGAPAKQGAEKTIQDADGVWYRLGNDNAATPITLNGKPFQGKTPNEPKVSDEDQFVKEYQASHKGATIAEAQRAFKKNEQLPPQTDRGQNFIDPTTNKLVRVEPGGAVPKGALTAAGENSINTPTAATRTMAETAPKVLDLANRASTLVDQQEKTLGPAASRWSEFMAGKVGAPNPEFTKLRTDVGLLQTALMRMHVGARGGEQMMEHFRDLIDTSKQSPENLRAALEEIKAYANAVKGEGTGNTGTLPGGISIQDIDAEIARRKKK